MSLNVIILYKLQECYENIRKKMAYFVSSDYDISLNGNDSKKLLSTREIEENLLRMSSDQLHNLWNSVFENMSHCHFNGDHSIAMNAIEDTPNRNPIQSDLVKDLVIVYKRITNVLSSLACKIMIVCQIIQ